MAKAKAKEIKEAPILKGVVGGEGGGGGDEESLTIDRIIVRGKTCIASIKIDTENYSISGYVDLAGVECPFSTSF